MSWSHRRRPRAGVGRIAYVVCTHADCERQIGYWPTNACDECHQTFCAAHLLRVTVETATLKLCLACAEKREVVDVGGEGLGAGD